MKLSSLQLIGSWMSFFHSVPFVCIYLCEVLLALLLKNLTSNSFMLVDFLTSLPSCHFFLTRSDEGFSPRVDTDSFMNSCFELVLERPTLLLI